MWSYREMRRWANNFFATLVAGQVDLWVHPTEPAPLGWFHAIDLDEARDVLDCFLVRKCSVAEPLFSDVMSYMAQTRLYSTYSPRCIIEEEP